MTTLNILLFILLGGLLGYVAGLFMQARKHADAASRGERAQLELAVLQEQYQKEQEERLTLKKQLEKQIAEQIEYKAAHASLTAAMESERQLHAGTVNQLQELKSEHENNRKLLSTTLSELEGCKVSLEREQTGCAEVKTQLTELQDEHKKTNSTLTSTLSELERYKTALEKEQTHGARVAAQFCDLQEESRELQKQLTSTLAELEHYKTALEKEKNHREEEAARIKEMQEKHFAQFRNLAGEIMEQNVGKLKDTNNESLDNLLKPLKLQLESLGKAVTATNETAAGNKASMEAAIKAMMEKTESLSHEAESLTLALRGNTKKQGDWGEMILERMLEESGLRKGEEYYIQENFKTEDGKDARPDVVIRFPDKRSVIVDSKVSLTAYALYTAAEKEEDRRKYLTAHVSSVRKHIDELSTRDYRNIVPDTISYVLMFMPNEASYMAALQDAPSLPIEAYRKKIVLISPTNLLMALQLAYNLWQKERQTQNVENIIDKATKLYDKLAAVQDSFEKVGKSIDSAQSAYKTALGQLFTGRGNYAKQLEDLRQMGIAPNKRLRLTSTDESQLALSRVE